MSVDYTSSNNGIFTHIGKIIKYFNNYKSQPTDPSTGLDVDRSAIITALHNGNQDLPIQGLTAAYQSWKLGYVSRRAALAGYVLARLQDPASVLNLIGAAGTDPASIVLALFNQMLVDSQTVQASSVSLGSVTAGSGNAGNGQVYTTAVLDGYTSPGGQGPLVYPALPAYQGRNTELAIPSETQLLVAMTDGAQGSVPVTFSWNGQPPDANGQYGIYNEGSGLIGSVTEVHGNTPTYLANADFESFTIANTPDDWNIDSGTVGTNIKSNTTNVAHGSSSLNFIGDGSTATIQVSQAPPAGTLNARQRYLVSAQIKADSSITAGTLTIEFSGTGYTPGSGELISIAPGSLPTSYQLNHFFVTMPAAIPTNMKLIVQWSGTPTNGKNLYIDDIGIAPVAYGGGVGVAVVRGTSPFGLGDRFSFSVTNTEGVFQRAFRQLFGFQLPSAASPTIADSLAQ
jgi:hypothetical protein